ncbi:ferritin-like domain-containing protein [Bengtsoniella intestinalis]|uniref:ferritin-like domain-containing protein n=1 Tax=Bengtsoniella intestinalis TaxID=3073143 RepID=UPI00391F9AC2
MHPHDSAYALPTPYPPIDQVHPNGCDLTMAYDLYAGGISEYTAIAQYVYHHLYAREQGFEALEKEFLSIAIVEMRHLALLGSLILKLGGAPKFVSPTKQGYTPWNATLIDYGCGLKDMILLDVKSEQAAICDYLHGAKCTQQAQIAALLQRISQDEELHLQAFTQMLHSI